MFMICKEWACFCRNCFLKATRKLFWIFHSGYLLLTKSSDICQSNKNRPHLKIQNCTLLWNIFKQNSKMCIYYCIFLLNVLVYTKYTIKCARIMGSVSLWTLKQGQMKSKLSVYQTIGMSTLILNIFDSFKYFLIALSYLNSSILYATL